ncbi:hypothetical protein GKE82_24525 [Conexibacter sp. W3-3-2]|uniref:hypothetical protein n=1 Tax=Conexibacter sp. W3-3-2 TaxID=2675227 RepID=UPI0012B7F634|nr:hypothetical protein [Conexibacter sp. W3-3-2]MTD47376.1 hypothetical protein [Conexibacter sp. W3-3-2]
MTPPGATPQIVVLEVTPSDGYQRHLLLEHGMRAPEVARTVIDLAVIQPADRAQILNALEQLSSALELSSRALIDRDGNVLQPALGVQLADDNTGSFVVSGLTGSLEAAALALLEDALASFAQERAVYDDLARALDGLVQVDRLQSRPAWSARHALTAEQGRRALRVYAALQRSRTLSELAYRQVVASDIEPTADEINITTLLSPELAQQLSDEVRDVAAAEDVRTAERTRWISQHGSERLRLLDELGLELNDAYVQERIAREWPGGRVQNDQRSPLPTTPELRKLRDTRQQLADSAWHGTANLEADRIRIWASAPWLPDPLSVFIPARE